MMKLKNKFLLAACLVVPLLSNARPRHLDFKANTDDRSSDFVIPIEATFDDELHELTLMFFDDGYSILVEVKDEKGYVIYTDYLMMIEGNKVQIPLKGHTKGKYTLSISGGKDDFIGDFVY